MKEAWSIRRNNKTLIFSSSEAVAEYMKRYNINLEEVKIEKSVVDIHETQPPEINLYEVTICIYSGPGSHSKIGDVRFVNVIEPSCTVKEGTVFASRNNDFAHMYVRASSRWLAECKAIAVCNKFNNRFPNGKCVVSSILTEMLTEEIYERKE